MVDRERPGRSLERIYGPLGDHLAARAAAGMWRVTLAFGAIEAILGRPLPATARHRSNHQRWWRGGSASAAHGWYGWLRAGWQIAGVDLAAETVTLARPGGTPPA